MHDIAKIRRLRLRKKLSQTQAAKKAGISSQHWSNVERGRDGRIRGISPLLMEKIAGAIGVRAKDLMT